MAYAARVSAALERFLLADERARRTYADNLLALPGAADIVLEKIRQLPPANINARRMLWRLAIFDALGSLLSQDDRWVEKVVAWLERGDATWEESANICAEVGFQAHLLDRPLPITLDMIRSADPLTVNGRALLHMYLVAMRLAYQWEAMEQCIADLGIAHDRLDPYARAYHVFALLAQEHPDALAEMERLLQVAGDDYRVHLTLVEGLRLSRTIPRQGELMLDLLSRPALSNSASPDPLYRKAFALRRLGRYEEALRAVDECLQRISPLQVRDRIRVLQERELIIAEQAIAEQAAAANRAAQERLNEATRDLEAMVEQQLETVRRAVSEGLFRVVEVLGLFTAIVALLGGSVASAIAADLAWWQRGLLILTAAAVAMGFFLTLRVIVRPPGVARRRVPSGSNPT